VESSRRNNAQIIELMVAWSTTMSTTIYSHFCTFNNSIKAINTY